MPAAAATAHWAHFYVNLARVHHVPTCNYLPGWRVLLGGSRADLGGFCWFLEF